jgi:hypothetical protein
MLQTLFKNDLVDGLDLMIFPITLARKTSFRRRHHPGVF